MLFRTASVPLAHDHERGRVEDGRGDDAEAAPFPVPAHQTGRADFPHPAFRQASSPGPRRDTQHLRPQHPTPSEDVEVRIPAPSALVPPAQEAMHAIPDVVLELPIGQRTGAIGEVRRPTAYEAVQLVPYFLPRAHVP